MKSAILSIVSATLFVAGVSAQLTINTPVNVVVCQPLQLTWSGGTAPYFLSVHPGAAPDDPALLDFGTQEGTSFLWTRVNFPVGTSLDLTLRDSAGLTSQSAPFTINTGSDTSCLNAGSSSPSGSSSSTPVPSTTGTGTTPTTTATTPTTTATTPGTTTSTTSRSSGSSSSSSSGSPRPASTSTTSNAAMPTNGISYGAAGVLGAVVAAVLV